MQQLSTEPARQAVLRAVLNASPDKLPVDIYANDKCVAGRRVQEVRIFGRRSYCISVVRPIRETGRIPAFRPAARGSLPNRGGRARHDGRGYLRVAENGHRMSEIYRLHPCAGRTSRRPFANLARTRPLGCAVDGTRLFRSVCFTEHTRYARLEPGTYLFRIRPTGSTQTGFITQEYTLERGVAYTLYAIGLTDGLPPLETVLVEDGFY